MFHKGERVTCIKTEILPGNRIAPPLVIDKVYEVSRTHTCKCGEEHIDVGLISEINEVTCYKCREVLPNDQHEGEAQHWAHSSRFKTL